MPWMRMEDSIGQNRKVIRAGPAAFGLWVTAIAHSATQLTDGFIAYDVIPRLVATDQTAHFEENAKVGLMQLSGEKIERNDQPKNHVAASNGHVEGISVSCLIALVNRLVEVGLFDVVPGGYCIHDYLDYNPSRAEVFRKRKADLARKRKKIK